MDRHPRWTADSAVAAYRTDRAGIPEISVASATALLGAIRLGRGAHRRRDGHPAARHARYGAVPALPPGPLRHRHRFRPRSRPPCHGELRGFRGVSLHQGQRRGASQRWADHRPLSVRDDQYGHGSRVRRIAPRRHRERALLGHAQRSERVLDAQPDDARGRHQGGGRIEGRGRDRQGGRRSGQPRQERLPGQYEP